jgi:hypothetical protein
MKRGTLNMNPKANDRFAMKTADIPMTKESSHFEIALTYLLTYLLTPWRRALFEKLIVTQPVKKIPLSCGTRRFITVFTKAHHWTLS